ncbi:MAG: hypothetical protein ACOC9I_01980, partial [Actinomycetota bacterium]
MPTKETTVSETPASPEGATAAGEERAWYRKPLNLIALAVIVVVALFVAFGG